MFYIAYSTICYIVVYQKTFGSLNSGLRIFEKWRKSITTTTTTSPHHHVYIYVYMFLTAITIVIVIVSMPWQNHYHPLSLSLSRVLLFYFRLHTYVLSPIRWWSDPIRLARRRSGEAWNCQALRKWWLLGQAQLLEMEPMEQMKSIRWIRCPGIRYSWCETQKSSALQHAPGCFVDSVHWGFTLGFRSSATSLARLASPVPTSREAAGAMGEKGRGQGDEKFER